MAASGGIDLLKRLENRELFSENLKPIKLLDRNRVKSLHQRDIKGAIFVNSFTLPAFSGHTGCVNALEFSNDEKYLLSGGDDGRVVLWVSGDLISRKEPKPRRVMKSQHYSNIFSLGFSLTGDLGMYLKMQH
jgi:WD40 repeat protein